MRDEIRKGSLIEAVYSNPRSSSLSSNPYPSVLKSGNDIFNIIGISVQNSLRAIVLSNFSYSQYFTLLLNERVQNENVRLLDIYSMGRDLFYISFDVVKMFQQCFVLLLFGRLECGYLYLVTRDLIVVPKIIMTPSIFFHIIINVCSLYFN